jgi:hypothetical protein
MARGGIRSAGMERAPAWIALWFSVMVVAGVAINAAAPKWLDFLSFWAAAQMIGGNPYDVAAHAAVEASAGATRDGLLPFVHPPTLVGGWAGGSDVLVGMAARGAAPGGDAGRRDAADPALFVQL